MHLIALPARKEIDENPDDDARSRIAHLLTGDYGQNRPDLDYQDSEGNSPMHYGFQLEAEEACDLVNIFLEKEPTPIYRIIETRFHFTYYATNEELRTRQNFQKIIHALLLHGADPNLQRRAVQLADGDTELHLVWKKERLRRA